MVVSGKALAQSLVPAATFDGRAGRRSRRGDAARHELVVQAHDRDEVGGIALRPGRGRHRAHVRQEASLPEHEGAVRRVDQPAPAAVVRVERQADRGDRLLPLALPAQVLDVRDGSDARKRAKVDEARAARARPLAQAGQRRLGHGRDAELAQRLAERLERDGAGALDVHLGKGEEEVRVGQELLCAVDGCALEDGVQVLGSLLLARELGVQPGQGCEGRQTRGGVALLARAAWRVGSARHADEEGSAERSVRVAVLRERALRELQLVDSPAEQPVALVRLRVGVGGGRRFR